MRVCVFLLVTAMAALALLTAACGGGGEGRASVSTPPAACGQGSELSQEQAIQCAVWIAGADPDNRVDPSTATARRMSECQAHETMQWEGALQGRSPNPLSENPVWLVEVRGEFSGSIGYGLTPDPSPPRAGRFVQVLGDGGAGGILFDEREEGPELSREKILERAFDEMGISTENDPDPSTATVTLTTFREALATLRQEGAPQDFSERPNKDDPVWLFEVRGVFADSCARTPRAGRYFLVLALDGFIESGGFIPYTL